MKALKITLFILLSFIGACLFSVEVSNYGTIEFVNLTLGQTVSLSLFSSCLFYFLSSINDKIK